MTVETRNGYKVTPEIQKLKEDLRLFLSAFIKKAGWNSTETGNILKCASSTAANIVRNRLESLSVDFLLKLLLRVGAKISFDNGKLTVILPKNNVYSAIAINLSEEVLEQKVADLKKLAAEYIVLNMESNTPIRHYANIAGLSEGRLYDLIRGYRDLVNYSFEYVLMAIREMKFPSNISIRYKA